MAYFILNLLVFIILKKYLSQHSSAFSKCASSNPPVDLSPVDLKQLIRFLKSQQIEPETINDIVTTEINTIREALEYFSGIDNEDMHLNIMELIHKYGFDAEEHQVETKDGYVLTVHRIPRHEGPVVFLMHGLFGSSDDWVTAGRECSLAYYLASKGFDVWMGNARGNKNSRQHITYSTDCAEFWDFSWEEIGLQDVPAMIDHALNTTGQDKVSYVGYSQGTTSFFVMCSELPAFNEKISIMVALAPVAWMSHLKSPILRILSLYNGIEYKIIQALGINEFLPDNVISQTVQSVICGNNMFAKILCANLLFIVFGYDRSNLNITNLPVIFSHFPSGASTKQLVHYGQEVESGRFRRFDYGPKVNMERYKSGTPPDYPVEKITTPIVLFYSDVDWMSNITDVMILRGKLPNVVELHFIKSYNHIDYAFAKNVNKEINPRIVDALCKEKLNNYYRCP